MTESGHDFSAQHQRQALDAVEISVLDSHHSGVGEQLLRVVVDELPAFKSTWILTGTLYLPSFHISKDINKLQRRNGNIKILEHMNVGTREQVVENFGI